MDELQSIEPIPQCACGAMKGCTCDLLKKLHELESRNQLLQFLMGLNSGYDQTRGQILSMDPLPSVNRTYYILQQIEKQKQITDAVNLKPDAEAFAATRDPRKPSRYVEKKDQKRSKIDRFCDYCKAKGHIMDQCFKIHGYLTVIKEKKGKVLLRLWLLKFQQIPPFQRQHGIVPLCGDECGTSPSGMNSSLVQTICQEVLRALQGKSISPSTSVGMANLAGKFSFINASSFNVGTLGFFGKNSWITDTGASDHMTPHLDLLTNKRKLNKPILVGLPDGSVKQVTHIGDIKVCPDIVLKEVLYVPEFRYNLLSVGKLLDTSSLITWFTRDGCGFQDLTIRVTVVEGNCVAGLYGLDGVLTKDSV